MLMNEDFASCLPCFIISLYLYLRFASLLSTHAACAHRLRAHCLPHNVRSRTEKLKSPGSGGKRQRRDGYQRHTYMRCVIEFSE